MGKQRIRPIMLGLFAALVVSAAVVPTGGGSNALAQTAPSNPAADSGAASADGSFNPTGPCPGQTCPTGAVAVLASGKVLAVSSGQASPKSESALFDPTTGKWRPTGPCDKCGFSRPVMVALPAGPQKLCGANCGKALLAGGWIEDAEGLATGTTSVFLFDPNATDSATGAKGVWVAAAPMTIARNYHTATLLPDGKVLVAGGCSLFHCYEEKTNTAAAEVFDPATGKWSPTGAMAVARHKHTATLLKSGKVLIVGGSPGGAKAGAGLDSAEIYDPAAGTWTKVASLALGRAQHTATLLKSGKVLVVGGQVGRADMNSAELYDPNAGAWTATGILRFPRSEHSATLLENGKVLVVGGDVAPANSSAETLAKGVSEAFDPSSGRWSVAGAIKRGPAYAVLLPAGPANICATNCGKALVVTGGSAAPEIYSSSGSTLSTDESAPNAGETSGPLGLPMPALIVLLATGLVVIAALATRMRRG